MLRAVGRDCTEFVGCRGVGCGEPGEGGGTHVFESYRCVDQNGKGSILL